MFFFFGIVAAFSSNLRAVNWRTIFWGIVLQLLLAVLVLKVPFVYRGFERLGEVVKHFINSPTQVRSSSSAICTMPGRPTQAALGPGCFRTDYAFQFAFVALPPILFVSAFFTVLYHFGILQWCVRALALVMVHLMGTSGAETLSVAANVFMGQTEAPLIVRPYVPRMTNSELFALMASGMAHISGALMVVYISYGADPVAVLTTCVMACPCSLYLSKLFLPEVSKPVTGGTVHTGKEKSPYVNAIDAAATGTSDGLRLALNVAAMLIVFIAFVAMFDFLLAGIKPGLLGLGISADSLAFWPDDLSLQTMFGWLFSPVAFLMGVAIEDASTVGTLVGYEAVDERTRRLPGDAALAGSNRSDDRQLDTSGANERSIVQADGLRADRLCQLLVGRHSARRHRGDGPRPAARFGAAGLAGAVRGLHGIAAQCGDGGVAHSVGTRASF